LVSPEDSKDKLDFTGERFVPGLGGGIEAEHVHRYAAVTELVRGKHVLDIACGEGYGSYLLAAAAASVSGVDIDTDSVDHARRQYQRDNLQYMAGSCQKIPIADASVEVVISFETIEHIAEQEEFLSEIKRVLQPGGFAIISTPDKRVYSDEANYKNAYHVKEFYESEYLAFLQRRFSNVSFLKQQFIAASLIVGGECNSSRSTTIFEEAGQSVRPYEGYKNATYIIAIVGDGALPEFAQSLMTVPGPSGFFIWDAADELRKLKAHKLNLDAVIARKSKSAKQLVAQRAEIDQRMNATNELLKSAIAERDSLRASVQVARAEFDKLVLDNSKVLEQARSVEFSLRATNEILRLRVQAVASQLYPILMRIARKIDQKQRQIRWQFSGKAKTGSKHTRELELIKNSGLFDEEFYVNRYPDNGSLKMEPALHYLAHGAAEGRDPHPLFDSAHYISQCPELLQSKTNPLVHYLKEGHKDIDPNPLFSTKFYLSQRPGASPNALRHYLVEGASAGVNPSLLFDTKFYLGSYPDVASSKINPLSHYLLVGAFEGRKPHPLFDPQYYLRGSKSSLLSKFPLEKESEFSINERFYVHAHLICQGQRKPPYVNPVLHFLVSGTKGKRDPHPLFSTDFYTKKYRDVKTETGPPFLHYLRNGRRELRQPHPLFDPAFYLEQYPELLQSDVDPLAHYLTTGWKEGANPSRFFDGAFYLKTYEDVAAARENPLVHYVTLGGVEGRLPNPRFDPNFYTSAYSDVTECGFDPFTHYVQYGVAENRPQNLMEMEQKRLRLLRQGGSISNATTKAPPVGQGASIDDTSPDDSPIAFCEDVHPDVSIIIPIYGQLDYTLKCLRSLSGHQSKRKFEVIVVDDQSPDDSFAVLSKIPGLKLVQAEKNGGFILSCNLGASIARGQYLVFLNNDTEVRPGWLDELIGTFDVHPKAGLVGSQLIYPNGRLQEAGGIIYQDGSAANYGRNDDYTKPEYNYVRSVDYCSGASIAIPKALFFEVGQFDTHYVPAYAEDVDLAFQVRKVGRDVLYQPFSQVIHFEGISSGTDIKSGVKAYQVANLVKIKERWADEIATHPRKGTAPHFERDRSTVKRVLIIDSFTPKPDQDAGSVLTFEWIQNLKSWGYHCTYVPMQNFRHEGKYTEDLQRIGVKCIYPPHFETSIEYLDTLTDEFDLVLIFRITVFSRYIEAIKRACPSAKILFHTIDLHYLRYQREAELEATPANSSRALEWKEKELSAIDQSDCSVLVSPAEEEVVHRDLPGANVKVIPLSAKVSPISRPFSERRDILFIGGFAHPPNIGAVEYFVKDVFPLVKAQLPGIKFFVLGAHPPKRIQRLTGFDVIVTGHVEDLSEYFGHCRLSVAPLQVGAGMKGKVLSSLAFGLPCVATPVAAEGIGLEHGKNILIGTSSKELAKQIVSLYTEPELWSSISSDGLHFIEENYSPEHNKERLASILKELGLPAGIESSKVPLVTT
jgi:O-antigen biosynthesis protein